MSRGITDILAAIDAAKRGEQPNIGSIRTRDW
jgi:hypothetical protein